MKRNAGLLILVSMLTGCATVSDSQWKDTCEAAKNTVNQKRSYETLTIEGTSVEFSIKGASKIAFANTLDPITIIPRQPETVREIMDGAKSIATTAAIGAIGYKAVDKINTGSTASGNTAATTTP